MVIFPHILIICKKCVRFQKISYHQKYPASII
uniref:Uncharacterized protein n=1 Tax=Arundo donax TaxID=35708 RepID=A0A0A9FWP3_ARUDO